jgi:hypothetical protein
MVKVVNQLPLVPFMLLKKSNEMAGELQASQ